MSYLNASLEQQLIRAMKEIFGQDEKRIEHALAVLGWARQILEKEPGDPEVVIAAAILHDIGIHEAERKHGSSAGIYQEREGPPIAGKVMEKLNMNPGVIDHVCRIVGSHHTARDIATPEFRILWDADWLVNLPDVFPDLTDELLLEKIERLIKTDSGKNLARNIFQT